MPKTDGVLVDGVDVALLVERLGPDRPAAGGQDVVGEHVRRAGVLPAGQHGDDALHGVAGEALTGAQHGDQLGDDVDGQLDRGVRTGEVDLVAADVDAGSSSRSRMRRNSSRGPRMFTMSTDAGTVTRRSSSKPGSAESGAVAETLTYSVGSSQSHGQCPSHSTAALPR
jgi:hypothetical protein